jgi:hypothetical protein
MPPPLNSCMFTRLPSSFRSCESDHYYRGCVGTHAFVGVFDRTQDRGEDAPETADLYFAYGKALLENAISQASVLGKEQPEDEEEPDTHQREPHKLCPGPGDVYLFTAESFSFLHEASGSGGPILSFSGDADDEGVDLFGQAVEGGEEEGDEGDGGDDAEPEDDFNAAWEVLDLARAIYQKQNEEEEEEEVKLKLADTFITLGDVSLETGRTFIHPSFPNHAQRILCTSLVFISQRNSIRRLQTTKQASSSR